MEQNEKDVLERYSYKFDIVEKECIPVFLPKIVKEGFAYTLDSLVEFRKNRMSRRINKNMVELQLSNVSQIVFEVTDACNLRCKYCAYGEFYEGYDMRTNCFMSLETGIQILQYFMDHWTKSYNNSYKRDVAISFYGGEPLLNMKFIRGIVAFLEGADFQQVNFFYNMTTNAVLLKQNIDFFVAHQFRILVSLDGNEQNHAYRIRSNGSPSFRLVYENLKYVKQEYPDYFQMYISFNAVLHNKNSFEEIYRFIYGEFGKIPSVSELNNVGISAEKQELFSKTFRSYNKSLGEAENKEEIIHSMGNSSPDARASSFFIRQFSGNVFSTYNDLFIENKEKKFCPTGTCFPFSKKVFVTVNGKILPCERIGQQFALGKINKKEVDLDFEQIANRFNAYYDKLSIQCHMCYHHDFCDQCLFNIEGIDESPICESFLNKEGFEKYITDQIDYLGEHPEFYDLVIRKMRFDL